MRKQLIAVLCLLCLLCGCQRVTTTSTPHTNSRTAVSSQSNVPITSDQAMRISLDLSTHLEEWSVSIDKEDLEYLDAIFRTVNQYDTNTEEGKHLQTELTLFRDIRHGATDDTWKTDYKTYVTSYENLSKLNKMGFTRLDAKKLNAMKQLVADMPAASEQS